MKKVLIDSLGCPKNLVDSEIMAGVLVGNNYEISNDINKADIVIVNTCGFIKPAVEEAISVIIEYGELKKQNKIEKLIVTGCLVERYKEEILNSIPEVDMCLGIKSIENIGDYIESTKPICMYGTDYDISFLNLPRVLTNSKTVYVKISDGCDNNCTYCAIPSIRGRMQSRKIEDIIEEVIELDKNGVKEIILVAQDVTAYGLELYGKYELTNLIKKILKATNIPWIRLLYCYPESITDELIDLMSKEKRLLSYLDIPLQHSSDRILKLMARKGRYSEYVKLIDKMRKDISDLIIRTTFIVGFPGENEEDVNNLKSFIEKIKFDRVGVFAYSLEEGTAAFNLPNRISDEESQKRRDEVMSLQYKISLDNNARRVDKIYDVIVESISEDGIFYMGRTFGEAPEIDSTIYITSKDELVIGSIVKAKVLNIDEYDLIGEVI